MRQVRSCSECSEGNILEQGTRQTQLKVLVLLLGELIKMNLQDKIKLAEEALESLSYIKKLDFSNKGARKVIAQHILHYIEYRETKLPRLKDDKQHIC